MKNENEIRACAEEIDQLVRTYKNPGGMANTEAAIRKHFGVSDSQPESTEPTPNDPIAAFNKYLPQAIERGLVPPDAQPIAEASPQEPTCSYPGCGLPLSSGEHDEKREHVREHAPMLVCHPFVPPVVESSVLPSKLTYCIHCGALSDYCARLPLKCCAECTHVAVRDTKEPR